MLIIALLRQIISPECNEGLFISMQRFHKNVHLSARSKCGIGTFSYTCTPDLTTVYRSLLVISNSTNSYQQTFQAKNTMKLLMQINVTQFKKKNQLFEYKYKYNIISEN
jgi:hypothetical protein